MSKSGSILKVAFRALSRNKLRSLLTTLGIIIGVACVIATIGDRRGRAPPDGEPAQVARDELPHDLPGRRDVLGRAHGREQLEALRATTSRRSGARSASVAYVSASIRTVAQVIYGNQNWSTSIQGGEVDWPLIRSWNVSTGQFFTDQDNRTASKVCVLGQTVATNLFGSEDPVGRTLRIKNIPFRVVGVLESKGGSMMGQDQDDVVIAPYETVRKKLMGHDGRRLDPRVGRLERAGRRRAGGDHGAPAPAPQDRPRAGRRLHDALADGDARAGRGAEPHDVDAPLVDRGRLAPRRRDRDHEHHARLRDGADARDRRADGDRRQGRRHPRAVPRRGRRALARGRLLRDRARDRDPALRREGRGLARRARADRDRRSRSPSRRSSASRSGSTRRSRRAGSTPSRPSATSSVNLPG